jgi:hypothetical protein
MSEGLQNLAIARLKEEQERSEHRFVDLRVQWLEDFDSCEVILDVGGRWDRKEERWIDDGEKCRIMRLHEGQYPAGYWFSEWLRYYITGEPRPPHLEHVWTMLLAGGRRGGKSDLLEKILATGAVAKPNGIIWGVSPTEPETFELEAKLNPWIPESWAYYRESELRWRFAHGTELFLLSAHNPAALKRGRADIIGLNEAQNMVKKAYTMVRAPVADMGGIVVAAMNPPDKPSGQWVMDKYEEAQSGQKTLALFELDPTDNPHINKAALEDMRHDVGELEYRRDVLGEFIEIGDLVWHEWSPRLNVKPLPDLGTDITRQFTNRILGRAFDYVISIDLQLSPHMAAAVGEFYFDPGFPSDPLTWFSDEIFVHGDEDLLIDEIEGRQTAEGGPVYTPERCALILDASAWWQDAERTKGRASADMFRARGWKYLYRPDRVMKKNPLISERVLATNARMKNANGRRAMFSVPENRVTNTALKRWENRNGAPYRLSEYAHASDAVSYLIWRFFPRRLKNKAGSIYEKINRRRSAREQDLDNL